MATREERLIGHSLLGRINQANQMVYTTSCFMRGIKPHTETKLVVYPKDAEGFEDLNATPVEPELSELTDRTNTGFTAVNARIVEVEQFLTRYTGTTQITNGLARFAANRTDIESDVATIKPIRTNALNAASLSLSKEQLTTAGLTVADYTPTATQQVSADDIPPDERILNTFQDLLDAMSFELQGKNSYTGADTGAKPDQIRELVADRLLVAGRYYLRIVKKDTLEVLGMKAVLDYLETNFPNATDLTSLEQLGQYIDARVPKLPLVRRWWNY